MSSYTLTPIAYNVTNPLNISQFFKNIYDNFVILENAFLNGDASTGILNNAQSLQGFVPANKLASNIAQLLSLSYPYINNNLIPASDLNCKIDHKYYISAINTYSSTDYGQFYAKLILGAQLPSSASNNVLFYDTTTNGLFKYKNGSWVPIPWQTLIQATPDWANGSLSIDAVSNLWIRSNTSSTNWYKCIPALGSKVVEITVLDNTNFTYLYYIAPGQQAIVRNSTYFPIVFSLPAQYSVEVQFYTSSTANIATIIYPNNTAVSTYCSEIFNADSTTTNTYNNILLGHFVCEIDAQNGMLYSPSTFTIRFDTTGNTWAEGIYKEYINAYGIHIFANYSNLPNAYWLGVVYSYTNNANFNYSITNTILYASILRTV